MQNVIPTQFVLNKDDHPVGTHVLLRYSPAYVKEVRIEEYSPNESAVKLFDVSDRKAFWQPVSDISTKVMDILKPKTK